MSKVESWHIRSAVESDRTIISALLSSAPWNHQHLDWVSVLDLLGSDPFYVAFEGDLPAGCLACPPDPPDIAWLRYFAVVSSYTPFHVWNLLWPVASQAAVKAGAQVAAVLSAADWISPILLESGFKHTNDVIFLEWRGKSTPIPPLPGGELRVLREEDLPGVAEVDQRSFNRLWRYSLNTLNDAYKQSTIATVIEFEGKPIAYQMSTTSIYGAHLARLAVDPEWQGRGLGKALVTDALNRLVRKGATKISVNTQVDNTQSLGIYQTLGFKEIGSPYPLYEINLHS
jgi:ribosomal-protein-alanine N-acetyltransferase